MSARTRASYAIACASVALGAAGQILLKSGVRPASVAPGPLETLSRALSSPIIWAGLATYAISALLWLVALSRMDLSAAYPLGAGGYVLVALASLAMGETVPPMRWLGIAAIVAGIILVSLPERRKGGENP